MSRSFGLAGVQMSVVPWDADATVDKMADAVRQISLNFPWVDMIVFHELAVPGLVQFVSAEPQNTRDKNAQSVPGPLTERLGNIASKWRKWLIPGSMYEQAGENIYNTALAISPKGEIAARYRKMFPWLPYEAGTTAGNEFCTFDIEGIGRFGLMICYDSWFPEVARTLAWMGAEVILQPTMTPTSDRELELVMCRANAIFNQSYFISLNGVGPYGGGRSLIVDPDGRILQCAGEHETILTEILDLDHVTRTREYGTIGLAQTLKQLRDSGHSFPPYQDGNLQKGNLQNLGELAFHQSLRPMDQDPSA